VENASKENRDARDDGEMLEGEKVLEGSRGPMMMIIPITGSNRYQEFASSWEIHLLLHLLLSAEVPISIS